MTKGRKIKEVLSSPSSQPPEGTSHSAIPSSQALSLYPLQNMLFPQWYLSKSLNDSVQNNLQEKNRWMITWQGVGSGGVGRIN